MLPRAEVLEKMRRSIAEGRPIIGAGAGTGLSAKCAEQGGADVIIIYNSGRYRMAGRGSMAGMLSYGDANAVVLEMAAEVLPVVARTPVLAGVNATDPFRLMPQFLRTVRDTGFSGVQNFPTVGLFDGIIRQHLEETGMGYDLEVEMIRSAHAMDLLTCPYVFNPDEAERMAAAGADILVPHMGLTTKGMIGAHTARTLEECAERIQAMHDAAKAINPEVLVLCHGGPISEPEDAAVTWPRRAALWGFLGPPVSSAYPPSEPLPARSRSSSNCTLLPHRPAVPDSGEHDDRMT